MQEPGWPRPLASQRMMMLVPNESPAQKAELGREQTYSFVVELLREGC